MLVFEHTYVLPPPDRTIPHLGLYGDTQIAAFHHCVVGIQQEGVASLVMLDQPLSLVAWGSAALEELGAAFIAAAWRVRAAGPF